MTNINVDVASDEFKQLIKTWASLPMLALSNDENGAVQVLVKYGNGYRIVRIFPIGGKLEASVDVGKSTPDEMAIAFFNLKVKHTVGSAESERLQKGGLAINGCEVSRCCFTSVMNTLPHQNTDKRTHNECLGCGKEVEREVY
jgi:hypothetical protein